MGQDLQSSFSTSLGESSFVEPNCVSSSRRYLTYMSGLNSKHVVPVSALLHLFTRTRLLKESMARQNPYL